MYFGTVHTRWECNHNQYLLTYLWVTKRPTPPDAPTTTTMSPSTTSISADDITPAIALPAPLLAPLRCCCCCCSSCADACRLYKRRADGKPTALVPRRACQHLAFFGPLRLSQLVYAYQRNAAASDFFVARFRRTVAASGFVARCRWRGTFNFILPFGRRLVGSYSVPLQHTRYVRVVFAHPCASISYVVQWGASPRRGDARRQLLVCS